MAKQSGLGSALFVGVYDISGDVGAINSAEISRNALEVTGIDKSALERIVALRDGSMSYAAFWNTTAGQDVPVLQAVARSDVLTTFMVGSTVGVAAASMVAKNITFPITRGQDGSLGVVVEAHANGYGLEWGEALTTGLQSFATGTVSGTSINLGAASTAFGAAAYLHVISVASGTATFTVQDSADDSSYSAITGLAFTGATGATTQRLQTAAGATIRQYVRIQGTGVHGAAVVAVNFVRYTEAGPV
jgi:hypothetical protein